MAQKHLFKIHANVLGHYVNTGTNKAKRTR